MSSTSCCIILRVMAMPSGAVSFAIARCTHEGCTVQFVPGESVVWCACHNGFYDLSGNVVSGPPPRPLERFVVNQRGEDIVVSRA